MDKALVDKIESIVLYDLFRVLDDVDDWQPDSELSQVELRIKKRIRKKILDCGNQIMGFVKQSASREVASYGSDRCS